jgi:hypothetical protein
MRAEKKSRWRADAATPFAPSHVVGGSFPITLLGNRLWIKTGPSTREELFVGVPSKGEQNAEVRLYLAH